MKIPRVYSLAPKRKLTDEQIEEGKRLLEEGNSERWVARRLEVSRANVRMHCKEGWKEIYYSRYKTADYARKYRNPERDRINALERYHILARLYPKRMRESQKKVREKIGKEYFRIKSREFRKRYPRYWEKYYYKV